VKKTISKNGQNCRNFCKKMKFKTRLVAGNGIYIASARAFQTFSPIVFTVAARKRKSWHIKFFLEQNCDPKFFHFSRKDKNSGTQNFLGKKYCCPPESGVFFLIYFLKINLGFF